MIWKWLRAAYARLFQRQAKIPALEAAPAPQNIEPVSAMPRKTRGKKLDQQERPGSFLHLEDILDQIAHCRGLLQKMRKFDRDAYNYHARLGARVLPHEGAVLLMKNSEKFMALAPASGMVFIFDETKKERPPFVVYFQKLERTQPHIAAPNNTDTLYRMSVMCIVKKHAYGYQFAVAVVDGVPRIVAERLDEYQNLPKGGSIHKLDWSIPPALTYHWRHTGHKKDFKSPVEFGVFMFRIIGAFYDASTEEFQVRAERGGVSVAFSVGLGRTPYFFKDRESEATVSGRKQKIFHAVEAHERRLRSGRVTKVVAHYRGARRFVWHNENVTITPPEFAAKLVDVKADELAPADDRSGHYEPQEAAEKIAEYLERNRTISKHDPPQGLAAKTPLT